VTNPKYVKSINISELVYTALSKRELAEIISKNGLGALQKNIVQMSFSRDNKYLAVLVIDKDKATKAIIYDWVR